MPTTNTNQSDDGIVKRAIAIAEAEAQRCRDGVSRCPDWSPAQAEWSRARDACLNIVDALRQALGASL